ncbi:unnamed protein product [Urochloa humidicola]
MLNSPGNSSAHSRHHHHCANLADHKDNSSSLSMKTPMHGVEAEEGVVDVEGAGVEEAMVVMVDMETTKVGTIRVVGIMIIKVDMAAMIIKVGMVVDMATTKADMETTKKMGIAEGEVVVCVEEVTGVTVEATKEAGVVATKEAGVAAMKGAGVVAMKEGGAAMSKAGVVVEGDMVAVEGEEWAAVGEGTEHRCKIFGLLVFSSMHALLISGEKDKLSEHLCWKPSVIVRFLLFSLSKRFGCEHNAFASFIMLSSFNISAAEVACFPNGR